MEELLAAIMIIMADVDTYEQDAEDWEYIADCIRQDEFQASGMCYRSMDTCSRELITPFARKNEVVKTQCIEALNIKWLF